MNRQFHIFTFDQLNTMLLYDILALRAEVFVVEQESAYMDFDYLDQKAHHVCLMEESRLIGYARLLAPGLKFDEATVGRLVLAMDRRGSGLGRRMMEHCMAEIRRLFGDVPIRIEAQHHLHRFYESMGYAISSDIYDWGGIPHVKMVSKAA
jgi:ElaA protein